MKWLFVYRRDLVVCYVYIFCTFVISLEYDFLVDAERMIVKMRETKPIFVCYGQVNSTTVLDFLHKACLTLAI